MSHSSLDRLARLDTNTVSDALDFLALPGATVGLRPLWQCPRLVGRASTVQLAPKSGSVPTVHLISPVIAAIQSDERVLVIAGGLDGRGVTMISARNRVVQLASGMSIQVAGVTVRENDYVIADRCGTVFVPSDLIDEVLDLAERIARRQDGMVQAVRSGRSVEDVMHDKEFEAIEAGDTR